MKITYFNKDQDYNLAVDYGKIMSSGWCRRLREFLHSSDMKDAMFSVMKMYSNKNTRIFPKKLNIFGPLNKLDVTEVDIAIINCNPRLNDRSNGIAFGNNQSERGDYDVALIALLEKICEKDKRRMFKDDFTLEHWINQFVFPYNVSLTGFANDTQRAQWFGFSRQVISILSNARQGLVFLFIGTEAQCRPYIDFVNHKKHTVLRHDILSYDALEDINLEIDAINGRDYRIRW